ncbi:hypothetical protein EV643_1426 [Kribbella sp. VKM Ac-2527]|uniref:Secreted protein n=1 Tax=Kribbella caucasensis TaxID=2512215 RepID=A0A4R6J4T5_9ACTN|nr:hypothetical protein [Kribbella sp. VKM Ac-2527]TDO29997.1 hypothetical protein EV643_1426 [Kribbella sp. VKM Ac-2527]
MRHKLAIVLSAAAALVGGTAAPASAGGAEHAFVIEDYDASEHFAAGEGPCVSWPGTFHEVRSGGYRLVTPPGGQQAGEFHINGVINGQVELIPDNATLPTYSGTYREKVNAVVTAFTDEGDVARVSQYRLRSTLHGTDGSALDLRLSGKFTMNANGVVVVSRDTFTCG